ncbi:MAG: hypothetical protein ACK552_17280 [Microcystis sp.]|nr:hypothetical protein [Microcystis aeruginosa LG13-12]
MSDFFSKPYLRGRCGHGLLSLWSWRDGCQWRVLSTDEQTVGERRLYGRL